MDISPDKDTLSCLTCRRRIERAVWVIWIELGQSGEFCDIRIPCIIYTRKSGLPVRDRIFGNFRKSKYRSKFLIRFLEITHQRVSLEKLWAIRKNWSCPEILDFYRKSLLTSVVWELNQRVVFYSNSKRYRVVSGVLICQLTVFESCCLCEYYSCPEREQVFRVCRKSKVCCSVVEWLPFLSLPHVVSWTRYWSAVLS